METTISIFNTALKANRDSDVEHGATRVVLERVRDVLLLAEVEGDRDLERDVDGVLDAPEERGSRSPRVDCMNGKSEEDIRQI